ncbi:acetylornithine deacetylase [Psychromarinibacter halotolerans]|uniref:Acetylornithine deacetylase n=1 Tax=Psychromarinibacter halotolerans TaxID=1775175 RepID=A0ABV7GWH4_9RHOB|nr:acetylornithine deacetylase [Psychromarinibacter halotolerans]MDF0598253.1 acetylornithine deacetylase [Psychromarinibacter halotolerans]
MNTRDILDRLIAFPSVFTADDYSDITDFAIDLLEPLGVACHRLDAPDGGRAGLFAATGPSGPGGVMLSAHLDVVPVIGQAWQTAPFTATERAGLIYGRGTSDMKGFAAAALHAMIDAARRPLAQPLKLALSYDEEAGCIGITDMIGALDRTIGRPDLCIVGEPTRMQIVSGHKGKTSVRVTFTGSAGHSAQAPHHVNALHLAADLMQALRRLQDEIAKTGLHVDGYAVPHSTIHVGSLSGGTALNMIPETAVLEFEIRHLSGEDVPALLDRVRDAAAGIEAEAQKTRPEARIEMATFNTYPGFDQAAPDAIGLVESLGGHLPPGKVDYGTDGGVIAAHGVPVLVCGPGDIARAHRADEYIAVAELGDCDAFLGRLVNRLETGDALT